VIESFQTIEAVLCSLSLAMLAAGTYGIPNTTISKGKGVVGEWEYVMGANPVHSATKQSKDAKDAPPPFRPSHTHASDRIEPIEYLHDPEVPKIK